MNAIIIGNFIDNYKFYSSGGGKSNLVVNKGPFIYICTSHPTSHQYSSIPIVKWVWDMGCGECDGCQTTTSDFQHSAFEALKYVQSCDDESGYYPAILKIKNMCTTTVNDEQPSDSFESITWKFTGCSSEKDDRITLKISCRHK